jgi:hypothetical protein
MSALKVLQSFPSQRKYLLSTLGVVEPSNSRMMFFYPTEDKNHLPHHVTFQIVVVYTTKSLKRNIFNTVVDEGSST